MRERNRNKNHDFTYFFTEGVSNMFTHGFMSFAAIGITVACLLIMGTFTLVAVNANGLLEDLEQENLNMMRAIASSAKPKETRGQPLRAAQRRPRSMYSSLGPPPPSPMPQREMASSMMPASRLLASWRWSSSGRRSVL